MCKSEAMSVFVYVCVQRSSVSVFDCARVCDCMCVCDCICVCVMYVFHVDVGVCACECASVSCHYK